MKKNDSKIYVGGTIHRLRKQDYPLPNKFYTAFNDSKVVVFESDGSELEKPENQKKYLEVGVYQDERTLRSVLSEDVYEELDVLARKCYIDLERMKKYKPSSLVSGFTYKVLKMNRVTESGVDAFFKNKARQENKQLLYLDTFDESISFLESINQENENDFIKYMIEDLENYETFELLVSEWKIGNKNRLLSWEKGFRQKFPSLHQTILIDRNHKWLPKIENLMETKETEFVLFGAMHLYGDDGVCSYLKTRAIQLNSYKKSSEKFRSLLNYLVLCLIQLLQPIREYRARLRTE